MATDVVDTGALTALRRDRDGPGVADADRLHEELAAVLGDLAPER
jgi:hypothetical protein